MSLNLFASLGEMSRLALGGLNTPQGPESGAPKFEARLYVVRITVSGTGFWYRFLERLSLA